MCLTEPHCGTDLGLIRTKAVPKGEGRYALSGTKIFISAGEHDLTENIVHLVLAKLPDAPPGVRGISLFLVPKRTLKDDGTAGPAKRGLLRLDRGEDGHPRLGHLRDALRRTEGYLIGAPHKGLRCMFTMMTAPPRRRPPGSGAGRDRLSECHGLCEGPPPGARAQGRCGAGGERGPDHRPPRRAPACCSPNGLLTRAPARSPIWTALQLDISRSHEDAAVREDADELVQLLTADHQGLLHRLRLRGHQPRGAGARGHGYIREHGMGAARARRRGSARSTRARTASRRSIWWAASCPGGPAATCGTSSIPPSPSSKRTRTIRSLPTS